MKSEKICISKKNLVIFFIIVFLLGVVGVSYRVQKDVSVRSKAAEPTSGFGDCGALFDSQMTGLGKKTDDLSLTIFKNRFIENSRMIAYMVGVPGNGCLTDEYLGSFSRNNQVSYTPRAITSEADVLENTRGLTSGRACCVKRNSDDKLSVEGEMSKLDIELGNGRFVIKPAVNSGNAQQKKPMTCINYGAPEGSKERNPQTCGTGQIYEEECGTDGMNRRYFKVGCGEIGRDGNSSCDFSCFNGANWNNVCKIADGKENPNVCLVPSPTPTEPPPSDIFNTANKSSGQTVVETNVNCSTNLKQMDGSKLKNGYYTCYTAEELNNDTSIDDEGRILLAPVQSTIYLKKDNLPRRVSTLYGQDKNESCKKIVDGVLKNGVCASTK